MINDNTTFPIHIFNTYFSGIVVQNPSNLHFYCISLYHLHFFVVHEGRGKSLQSRINTGFSAF